MKNAVLGQNVAQTPNFPSYAARKAWGILVNNQRSLFTITFTKTNGERVTRVYEFSLAAHNAKATRFNIQRDLIVVVGDYGPMFIKASTIEYIHVRVTRKTYRREHFTPQDDLATLDGFFDDMFGTMHNRITAKATPTS